MMTAQEAIEQAEGATAKAERETRDLQARSATDEAADAFRKYVGSPGLGVARMAANIAANRAVTACAEAARRYGGQPNCWDAAAKAWRAIAEGTS